LRNAALYREGVAAPSIGCGPPDWECFRVREELGPSPEVRAKLERLKCEVIVFPADSVEGFFPVDG
jgi:hypothetical protein